MNIRFFLFHSAFLLFALLFIGCDSSSKQTVETPTNNSLSKVKKSMPATPPMDQTGVNLSVIAKEICPCTKETTQLLTEIEKADPVLKQEAYKDLSQKLGESMQTSIICAQDKKAALTSKFLDKKLFMETMRANCPGIHNTMLLQIIMKINQAKATE